MTAVLERPTPVAPRIVHAVWGTLLLGISLGPAAYALIAPRSFSSAPLLPFVSGAGPGAAELVASQVSLLIVALAGLTLVLGLPTATLPRHGQAALVGLAGAGSAVVLSAVANGLRVEAGLLAAPLIFVAVLLFPRPPYTWFERRVVLALRVYVWGSLVTGAVFRSWAAGAGYESGLLGFESRLGGLTTHPNALGPLAVALVILEWKRPTPSRVPLILAATTLLWTQSKTSWACLGVVAAIEIARRLRSRIERPTVLPTVVLLFVLGFTAYVGLGLASGERTTRKGDDTTETFTGRTAIWEVTLEVWRSDPLVGVGPRLWDDEMDLRNRGRVGFPPGHAHNQLAQALGEAGLLGAVPLVVGLLGLGRLARRAHHATNGVAGGLFVVLAVQCFTEVPLRSVAFSASFFFSFTVVALLLIGANEEPA